MVIPIIIGALGTVTKGLVQGLVDLEIRGRVEIVQISILLRSTRILNPGNLGKYSVTQTPLKNYQLTLV